MCNKELYRRKVPHFVCVDYSNSALYLFLFYRSLKKKKCLHLWKLNSLSITINCKIIDRRSKNWGNQLAGNVWQNVPNFAQVNSAFHFPWADEKNTSWLVVSIQSPYPLLKIQMIYDNIWNQFIKRSKWPAGRVVSALNKELNGILSIFGFSVQISSNLNLLSILLGSR